MSLSEYYKKRNFSKTPEPRSGFSADSFPIFVVQKHDARSLHYDLRLEHEGVLLSWAVHKEPSNSLKIKRLATQVEDHPLDYQDFEGTIPEGNYGAGAVIVWDKGDFATENAKNKHEVAQEIARGLKKGHFIVYFLGKKLKGGFIFAKLKDDEWLIFKKNDEYAGESDFDQHSVKSGKTLPEISGENKVEIEEIPGEEMPMPHNVKPMLAFSKEVPFNSPDFIFEIKWDGYRSIAEIEKGQVSLYSRNLQPLSDKFKSVTESLRNLNVDSAIVDGEIVVLKPSGKPDFQSLQNYTKEKTGSLFYMVFDLLYLNGKSLYELPLLTRKSLLKKIMPAKLRHVRYCDHIDNSGVEFFQAIAEKGIEGMVAKEKASRYLPGARSRSWLKIKKENTREAIIAGFTKKDERNAISSLILGAYSGETLIFIGHVGSGFNEKSLLLLEEIFSPLRTEEMPFPKKPQVNGTPYWLSPIKVCTIKYREITGEGILRQPVFVGLRDDVKPEEVKFNES